MPIAIQATTGCNLGCTYCYEEPDRKHSQAEIDAEYDIEKIIDRLEQFHDKYPDTEIPSLHGGEPLLMRNEHLERLFEWTYERYDLEERGEYQKIQTNATLIQDHHIEMFEKYRVAVGVSCDGPADLNRKRLARSEIDGEMRDTTDTMTQRTVDAIERLMDADTHVAIIVVLTDANAGTDERFEQLLDWMDELTRNDVFGHFNPAIPYEDVQQDDSLSVERLKEVYLRAWEWVNEEPYRRWDPMTRYKDNLLGNQLGACINSKCDVFNAGAAKKIKGDGSTTGCGKTWAAVGDGGDFLQGDSTDSEYDVTEERYDMLKQVPGPYTEGADDQGGCKGCKFWNVCQGGCPSSGLEYDYRNRTRWCEAKYALYEQIEKDMRSMFGGIRLVTDAPWDAPLADQTSHREIDIRPFAGLHWSQSDDPSAVGGSHDEPSVAEIAADGAADE